MGHVARTISTGSEFKGVFRKCKRKRTAGKLNKLLKYNIKMRFVIVCVLDSY
jgi:hypothetical protein